MAVGKTKFWRKMAEKYVNDDNVVVRTGRQLKAAMGGQNHPGFLLPIHLWLFKSAGIQTPEFDKLQQTRYNMTSDSPIEDVVNLNEGVLNAA